MTLVNVKKDLCNHLSSPRYFTIKILTWIGTIYKIEILESMLRVLIFCNFTLDILKK